MGIYLGVYGVKVVNEKYIRLVTSVIILLCVFSRGIAIPMYLRQLGYLAMDARNGTIISTWPVNSSCSPAASAAALIILYHVIRAYMNRRKITENTAGGPKGRRLSGEKPTWPD